MRWPAVWTNAGCEARRALAVCVVGGITDDIGALWNRSLPLLYRWSVSLLCVTCCRRVPCLASKYFGIRLEQIGCDAHKDKHSSSFLSPASSIANVGQPDNMERMYGDCTSS